MLRNEAMTRGLADPEARVLMEWLVDRAEEVADRAVGPVEPRLEALCRRGRAISRFVVLWCHYKQTAAALQLAAAERFSWPFPEPAVDPCELMQCIVAWENRRVDG
jgi:hypothetical protein